jgi:hypothetical protein
VPIKREAFGGVAFVLTLLVCALPVRGQEVQRALRIELMAAPNEPEHHVIKLGGALSTSRQSLSGYVDFFGEGSGQRYSELWWRTNVTNTGGLRIDLEEKRGVSAVVRAGYVLDLPAPTNFYFNVTVLPFAFSVIRDRKILRTTKVSFFGSFTAGDFQLENWTAWAPTEGRSPYLGGELTARYSVIGPLAAEVQLAKDVRSAGWAARFGARYQIF